MEKAAIIWKQEQLLIAGTVKPFSRNEPHVSLGAISAENADVRYSKTSGGGGWEGGEEVGKAFKGT